MKQSQSKTTVAAALGVDGAGYPFGDVPQCIGIEVLDWHVSGRAAFALSEHCGEFGESRVSSHLREPLPIAFDRQPPVSIER